MIDVDLIGQIRRAYFEQRRPIKEIVRLLSVSRATVRKVVRGQETEFKYERSVQPAPKLGEWIETLTGILEAEAKLPRRERRSTQRLFEELRGRGYDGAHDSVHRFVKAWRDERARVPAQAFVPMSFAPGDAYQFDWSHETITLQGLPVMIKAAHMKLSHSRMPFVRAYFRETQELVFDAHDKAFAFYGGVCRRGIYDNMKTAVEAIFVGKAREYNRRFLQMCSHHLIEPVACTPASGWEKGQVENQVGNLRDHLFRPKPRVKSLAELNAWLEDQCIAYAKRTKHPEFKDQTIWEVFEAERTSLMDLRGPFDGFVEKAVRASTTCLIMADHNRYSIEARCGEVYSDGPGMPPLPTRLMAGLAILKHTFDLSDEELCARWVENPYFQYFCGEEFFLHELPFDRSSLTRWRQRMGEERIAVLLQESLTVAVKTGAIAPQDTRRVIIDTTVQPKNVMFPTDAKLLNRAREKLVTLAKKVGLDLRQSYVRVGKLALIKHQRYAHAKQFKRANKALRTLKTYLGRTIRDIARQIAGEDDLQDIFRKPLHLASRVLEQRQNQRGKKVYSLHAPEVECIGKGKAHAPYEFGVKVSIATTLHRSKGGQFALHAKALPGNPYDGHTLATIIPDMESTIGNGLVRILADAGYRGHNAPLSHRFKVFTSGQKRRMTPAVKREMKRRAAVEPVIGHIKNDHRMDRNYLAGTQGDAINAILAAAGYNFSLLLKWLRRLLRIILAVLFGAIRAQYA